MCGDGIAVVVVLPLAFASPDDVVSLGAVVVLVPVLAELHAAATTATNTTVTRTSRAACRLVLGRLFLDTIFDTVRRPTNENLTCKPEPARAPVQPPAALTQELRSDMVMKSRGHQGSKYR